MKLTSFAGGVMDPAFYTMLFTMHGTIMVFFVLSTAPVSGFGNILIPLQVGARDMAFPFLNGLSYWTFLPGCVIVLLSFFVETGAAAAGQRPERVGQQVEPGRLQVVGQVAHVPDDHPPVGGNLRPAREQAGATAALVGAARLHRQVALVLQAHDHLVGARRLHLPIEAFAGRGQRLVAEQRHVLSLPA